MDVKFSGIDMIWNGYLLKHNLESYTLPVFNHVNQYLRHAGLYFPPMDEFCTFRHERFIYACFISIV
jgi:hypothetical protein